MRRRKLSHIVGTVVVLLFLFVFSVAAAPIWRSADQPSSPISNDGLACMSMPSYLVHETTGMEWHYYGNILSSGFSVNLSGNCFGITNSAGSLIGVYDLINLSGYYIQVEPILYRPAESRL